MSLVLGSSLFFFKVKDGLNSLGPCTVTVIFPVLSANQRKSYSVTIKMKAAYFSVVLFIMAYKVLLTFETMDETLKCGHSKFE